MAAPSINASPSKKNGSIARVNSKTAPARLEGFEEEEADEDNALFKVLNQVLITDLYCLYVSSSCPLVFATRILRLRFE